MEYSYVSISLSIQINLHHFEDTQGRCALGEKFGPKIIYLEGKYYRNTNVSFQSHDILADKLILPSISLAT